MQPFLFHFHKDFYKSKLQKYKKYKWPNYQYFFFLNMFLCYIFHRWLLAKGCASCRLISRQLRKA